MSANSGTKAVIAALVANLGIAGSKLAVFLFTGSASMLSEAIHSLADSGNQLLLLVGGKHARKASNQEHQFGFGRVRYIYGFIVAIVLFVVGGLFSMFEGWEKIAHPHELSSPWIALGVLGVAIVLESFSLRTALKEIGKVRGKRSLWRFVRDSRQPELPVVVLEDIAALTGLVLASTAVAIAMFTGDARWDGVGAFAIGALLVVVAIILTVEMTSMLVGESALVEDQAAIEAALLAAPIVQALIHLRTIYISPDELLVAAKVAVAPEVTATEITQGIDQAEELVRAVVPHARYLFLEPDLVQEK